jgi:hypothetical protein
MGSLRLSDRIHHEQVGVRASVVAPTITFMSPLISQILVAAVGSFLGAAGAVVAAIVLRQRDERRQETSALKGLLVDIYFRRALVAASARFDRNEFDRATRSILDLRAEVRSVRGKLRPKSPAFDLLSELTRLCNGYLELTDRKPKAYLSELAYLRVAFAPIAEDINVRFHCGLADATPGSGALNQPVSASAI